MRAKITAASAAMATSAPNTGGATREGGSVGLEIVNDRPAPAAEGGSGLVGLDARARELGGRLVTEHTAERFVLHLDVPISDPRGRPTTV